MATVAVPTDLVTIPRAALLEQMSRLLHVLDVIEAAFGEKPKIRSELLRGIHSIADAAFPNDEVAHECLMDEAYEGAAWRRRIWLDEIEELGHASGDDV